MKLATQISILMAVALILLAIADVWFDVVSGVGFFKLTVTAGLLVVLLFCLSLIKRK